MKTWYPITVIMRNGKEVTTAVGVHMTKAEIKKYLDRKHKGWVSWE